MAGIAIRGPQLMAEMTARAAKIIRKVDPAAAVVAASSSTRLTAAYEAFFPEYLAALKKRDWPIDVLAVHLYPPGPGTPGERVVDAEAVLAAVRKAGAPDDVEVWDTEVWTEPDTVLARVGEALRDARTPGSVPRIYRKS